MRIFWVSIWFSTVLFSQNFSLRPLAFTINKSTGGDWNAFQTDGVLIGGFGGQADWSNQNWKIMGRWVYTSVHGMSGDPFSLSPDKGKRFSQSYSMLDGDFWFDDADMLIQYKGDNYSFEFGKYDRFWGPGMSSLTVSNRVPSFPQFGFEWDVLPNLKVSYFHGFLNSDILDSSRAQYYTGVGTKQFDISRSVAGHRLEWQPFDFLSLGATDLVVYAVRPLEVTYLMPFIPFWALQHYLDDTDNIQMAGDITLHFSNQRKAYIVWLLDEWSIENTFNKENERNWFGWQFGLEWIALMQEKDRFQIEYTWTDHRIYRHRFNVNDAFSSGYPLGFWAGPHAQELYAEYVAELFGFDWVLSYSNVKRGEVTDAILENQYDQTQDNYQRFSGLVEERTVMDIQLMKSVWKQDLLVYLGVSVIDWKNAGFDPFNPGSGSVKDINKTSFTVGFSYNFRPPGLAGRNPSHSERSAGWRSQRNLE
ncbi:MAG: hypothetical protein HOD97_06935 [Candidatus Marinimicrobia bacterium]|jgi:hypothetical protein|nr:hypothetical protein [Candidatus Neomarinimicrobiota bacterium]MBT3617964.1 hypothetical protein [Candidatus Neomarinimicrobiota bacterium]MBT3829804.1 hypothetical protein [Candidatus Neomarinimicrobiota bacterium]MBT3997084.1 hypothetical protein [Candidatus Neomarinimicrobiota bacterium]MBT4281330.1 hypothetical protein [Candidatus Neomarinimicrobiota bacterium]